MRTPRTPTWSKALAAAALATLATPPARAARPAEAPEPAALLDAALTEPSVPYEGRVMVTQWYGKRTRAEEMRVFVLPPDKVRREFLAPDGAVRRVSVSDGEEESLRLVRSGRTVLGNAVRSYEKVLPPELERQALLDNYELRASSGEKVAGRATWRLEFRPKVAGKSWQTLWLDQDTKVVLQSKRYLPRRPYASQARFLSFEPRKAAPDSLFEVEDSSGAAVEARALAPKFLTLDQLRQATGAPTRLPDKLPGGFIFESADAFKVGRSVVRHARYTDGLSVLSIFLTDRPVRLPKNGAIAPGAAHLPGPLRASLAGKILQWASGPRHYTLMGDVSRELMGDIAKSLR